jgi:hypothetical protein
LSTILQREIQSVVLAPDARFPDCYNLEGENTEKKVGGNSMVASYKAMNVLFED